MKPTPFVHLNCHSHFTMHQSICKPAAIVQQAVADGMPAVALTDNNMMTALPAFQRMCNDQGIKPILGLSLFVAPFEGSDTGVCRLTLLAQNNTGYRNLVALVNAIPIPMRLYEKVKRTPYVHPFTLEQYTEGLFAISTCYRPYPGCHTKPAVLKVATAAMEQFHAWYGKQFHLALIRTGQKYQPLLNARLLETAREKGIAPVAINPVFYLKADHVTAWQAQLAEWKKTTMDDPRILGWVNRELYFKTSEQMRELFRDVPDAVENTFRIAQQCTADPFKTPAAPPKDPYAQHRDPDVALANAAAEGLEKRYGTGNARAKERLYYELKCIKEFGLSQSFMITRWMARTLRREGVQLGPGRDPALCSLVCYCLEITSIDPLAAGLYFERLLPAMRAGNFRIGLDVQSWAEWRVCKSLGGGFYAKSRVALAGVYYTRNILNAFEASARQLGYSDEEMVFIRSLVPVKGWFRAERYGAGRLVEELPQYRELFELAGLLKGQPVMFSGHHSSMVFVNGTVSQRLPVCCLSGLKTVAQYMRTDLENMPGVFLQDMHWKSDLEFIRLAIKNIREQGGTVPEPVDIPLDDPRTLRLFNDGRTVGVNWPEDELMQGTLREFDALTFTDLVAMMVLYWPDTPELMVEYAGRRNGTVAWPALPDKAMRVLEETCGMVLYFEQVMALACKLAGFTPEEAYQLERALAKGEEEQVAFYNSVFVREAVARGMADDDAEEVFSIMVHADTCSKAHAYGVTMVAWWCGYMKVHYPREFLGVWIEREDDEGRIGQLKDEIEVIEGLQITKGK